MLSQKYVYENVEIKAVYTINYVLIWMYRDGIKVHESITYTDEVMTPPRQILMYLIEMVTGEPFVLKKFEVVKTKYFDD